MRCDQNKNNFIYLISFPVINEKLIKYFFSRLVTSGGCDYNFFNLGQN
jgi:hypothetical protein